MPKLLFIGDIVGRPGRTFVARTVQPLREQLGLDFIVANAENAAGGSGITAAIATTLHNAGVDGITLGDHVWDQRGFDLDIDKLPFLCRPANLPEALPGKKYLILENNDFKVGIFTVLGTTFMKKKVACPFRTADALIEELKPQVDAIMVEIHAEATSEKISLGWYLDGRVALVVGTHTHVTTADDCILPKGTAYLTDVGMAGPHDSVLGVQKEIIIETQLYGIPKRFDIATEDVRMCTCLVDIDAETGLASSFDRFCSKDNGDNF